MARTGHMYCVLQARSKFLVDRRQRDQLALTSYPLSFRFRRSSQLPDSKIEIKAIFNTFSCTPPSLCAPLSGNGGTEKDSSPQRICLHGLAHSRHRLYGVACHARGNLLYRQPGPYFAVHAPQSWTCSPRLAFEASGGKVFSKRQIVQCSGCAKSLALIMPLPVRAAARERFDRPYTRVWLVDRVH